MSIWQDVALPASLDDYLKARDDVREKVRHGYKALHEADKDMRRSHRTGIDSASQPRNSLEQALADVERKFWRLSFGLTGFGQLMDAQAHDEMEEDLAKADPPEFTRENIIATFGDLLNQSNDMWRRGVVNLFRTLSGNFRTNDAFKVGPKIIMSNATSPLFLGKGRHIRHGKDSDRINDLDRVLRTIDGEEHYARQLESAMNEAFQEWQDYEDERVKARTYKNGNIHLWLKQQSHIDRINKIIAEHFGETLADGR